MQNQKRRSLVVVILSVFVLGLSSIYNGALAQWFSQVTNTGNLVAAGQISLELNTDTGTPVTTPLIYGSLMPGQKTTLNTFFLKNVGNVPGNLTVQAVETGTAPTEGFTEKVTVNIYDSTNASIWSGTLKSLQTAITLPGYLSLAVGDNKQFSIQATLASDTASSFYGQAARFDLVFKITQQ